MMERERYQGEYYPSERAIDPMYASEGRHSPHYGDDITNSNYHHHGGDPASLGDYNAAPPSSSGQQHQVPVQMPTRRQPGAGVPRGGLTVQMPRVLRHRSADTIGSGDSGSGLRSSGLSRRGLRGSGTPPRRALSSGPDLLEDESADVFQDEGGSAPRSRFYSSSSMDESGTSAGSYGQSHRRPPLPGISRSMDDPAFAKRMGQPSSNRDYDSHSGNTLGPPRPPSQDYSGGPGNRYSLPEQGDAPQPTYPPSSRGNRYPISEKGDAPQPTYPPSRGTSSASTNRRYPLDNPTSMDVSAITMDDSTTAPGPGKRGNGVYEHMTGHHNMYPNHNSLPEDRPAPMYPPSRSVSGLTQDPLMDASALTVDSNTPVSGPGPSYSNDGGVYAREGGLQSRYSHDNSEGELPQPTYPPSRNVSSFTSSTGTSGRGGRYERSVSGSAMSVDSNAPATVPGAVFSTDGGIFARKAGLNSRRDLPPRSNSRGIIRNDSGGMDTSSVSVGSTSVPGATFSTDNGVYSRKAGLRGRSSVNSLRSFTGNSVRSAYSSGSSTLMEDESNTSVPGAVFEPTSDLRRSPASKLGLQQARGDDSLQQVDQNIRHQRDHHYEGQTVAETGTREQRRTEKLQKASEGSLSYVGSSHTGSKGGSDRYSYQPGASALSVPDSRYAHKMASHNTRMDESLQNVNQNISSQRWNNGDMSDSGGAHPLDSLQDIEGRYHAKVAGADLRRSNSANNNNDSSGAVGAHHEESPQNAAIRAKLDDHFGPLQEEQRRSGDFSHLRLLNPPRRSAGGTIISSSTDAPSNVFSPESIGTESEQELSQMMDEPEDMPPRPSHQTSLPRELTVEADVEFAAEQAPTKKKKQRPKLWFFTPWGMCISCTLVAAAIMTIIGVVVLNKEDGDEGSSSAAVDAPDDDLPPDITFEDSLPASTKAILAEQDPDSPQYKALQWLQEEDLFGDSPVWRQRQRFTAATIYFSFYHDEEQQDMPWFQHNVDECDWLWDPDSPSICDSGRYLTLSLRLDSRQQNNVNLPDFYGMADTNSTKHSYDDPFAPTWLMPAEIGMLSIEKLILSHAPEGTRLQDLWPPELMESTDLVHLEVRYSPGIGGSMPSEIGLVSSLKYLYIEGSSMTGSIPTEVGSLQRLEEFNVIESPLLAGTIPTEMGLLTDLTLLWIFDNSNITGPIPTQFGQLSLLGFFSLRGDDLTGTIPSELGMATTIHQFRLGNNRLVGTIPPELSALRDLRLLDVDGNNLSGTIPDGLCSLRPDQVDYVVDCDQIKCCDHVDGSGYVDGAG